MSLVSSNSLVRAATRLHGYMGAWGQLHMKLVHWECHLGHRLLQPCMEGSHAWAVHGPHFLESSSRVARFITAGVHAMRPLQPRTMTGQRRDHSSQNSCDYKIA